MTSARAEDRICRDVKSAIDGEVTNTSDPRILVGLASKTSVGVLPALLQRTKSTDATLSFSAYLAIGLSRHAEALKVLRDAGRPTTDQNRLGRALGLLALGDASGSSTIAAVLAKGNVLEKRLAAESLAWMSQKRPQLLLHDSLEDPDELVRFFAAKHLLRSVSGKSKRALAELLKSDTQALRSKSASLLLRADYAFKPDEMNALSLAQRLAASIQRGNLRALSGPIRAPDATTRAVAHAALALLGTDTDAQMKKLEKVLIPKPDAPANGEALITLALLGDLTRVDALEALDNKEQAEHAVAVLFTFSRYDELPSIDSSLTMRLAQMLETWSAKGLLDDIHGALAMRAINRLDATAGLVFARARIAAKAEGRVLRAAMIAVGRRGIVGDVPALLEVAKRVPAFKTRVFRAASHICAR